MVNLTIRAIFATWILCLSAMTFVTDSPAESVDVEQVATLLEFVIGADEATAVECLNKIIHQGQSGELKREQLKALRARLSLVLQPIWTVESIRPLHDAALQLAILWGDSAAVAKSR